MLRATIIPLLLASFALGQTTQGLIAGRVVDAQTGAAVARARVLCGDAEARSDPIGYFALPLISPGIYRVRAAAPGYQPQEVYNVEVAVAGRVDLSFRLRRLDDVWEAGQYRSVFLPGTGAVINFYGPDVDASRSAFVAAPRATTGALEATLSQVVDPAQVRDLPLAGRDLYTMIVTLPGVAADAATARGLGLSAGGQRPAASNFLLDGVEYNSYLTTGPLAAVSPEAVGEYRISSGNWSAEYGLTSGFIANAVTRAGGSRWHGTAYWYGKNDALNAAGFQQNALGLPRTPVKEGQPGFHIGGPLARGFSVSSALEYLRSRGRGDPVEYRLPTARLLDLTASGSAARRLLTQFAPPAVADGAELSALWRVAPPAPLDRWLALERADWTRGTHRLFGRLALAHTGRPDFLWSPYPDFTSAMNESSWSAVAGVQSALRPNLTNEARTARSVDTLAWDRPHPEIPTLSSGDGTLLPGSAAFYAYRNRSSGWEALDNLTWLRGAHIFKFGGGVLSRGVDGWLTAGRDAFYGFRDIVDFALDRPLLYTAAFSRQTGARSSDPDYARTYTQLQFHLFAQDTFRAARRLTLDYGVRYESFGAPRSTGDTAETTVELGSGTSFPERLASARLAFNTRDLYRPDRRDWAGRFGFSVDPAGRGRTLVRGAWGIFYDRPFDNLWQSVRNNAVALESVFIRQFPVNFLASGQPSGIAVPAGFPHLTLFQQDLRNGYAESWFAGIQQRVADNWTMEIDGRGALGRRLITTDLVNRTAANPDLGTVQYRGAQGASSYSALAVLARYRIRRAQFQAAYTWSHSIDNQSDALAGDFFDVNFARAAGASLHRRFFPRVRQPGGPWQFRFRPASQFSVF